MASAGEIFPHGTEQLSRVTVDAYNAGLRSGEGFVGDRANTRAFKAILDDWRDRLARDGKDPLGDVPSEELSTKALDELLAGDPTEAAAIIHGVVEEFSVELATVIRRFMRLKKWRDTERIVVGGGFRQTRMGELAICRTTVLLKADGVDLDLIPIRHLPDHAGLVGSVQLIPSWVLAGHQSILAVDIGGTNIRAGIVELHADRRADLSEASVAHMELWRHGDESPKREDAVAHLAGMLNALITRADEEGLQLAPFIGVGCPGVILADGSIEKGGQNLPGNWESQRFNLAQSLREAIPRIGEHDTVVVMHNDAVVQGLSQLPFMQDVRRWGVLTIGTGLGNARFTNRET